MKLLFILFAVVFCLVSVSGRNLHDNTGNEEYSEEDSIKQVRDPTAGQMRHRRRSRQSFYDYNYRDYRRDYNRQQDDTYSQIIRLLDEIASNIRQPPPPPPPQPIYIPYPVPYYVPQYINCNGKPTGNSSGIKFGTRWPEMEDDRQNFGIIPGVIETENSDGSSPVNFDRNPTSESAFKPPVQVAAEDSKPPAKKPGLCKAAVLTCCNFENNEEQRTCFLKYNCRNTFETGLACRPEVIKKVLDEFAQVYAPINQF